jgi:hypothetical protein
MHIGIFILIPLPTNLAFLQKRHESLRVSTTMQTSKTIPTSRTLDFGSIPELANQAV